jgi:hypothetical protein
MCILHIYSDGSELLMKGNNNKELFVLQWICLAKGVVKVKRQVSDTYSFLGDHCLDKGCNILARKYV